MSPTEIVWLHEFPACFGAASGDVTVMENCTGWFIAPPRFHARSNTTVAFPSRVVSGLGTCRLKEPDEQDDAVKVIRRNLRIVLLQKKSKMIKVPTL